MKVFKKFQKKGVASEIVVKCVKYFRPLISKPTVGELFGAGFEINGQVRGKFHGQDGIVFIVWCVS